ncbi:uncharacterized protein LOC143602927 [Bidens hawaiensis]|uniref:uncharacterized protein LOC143602927 n=1 Tax=Bidens hawaiensis TaxID=980011 RepID=UPI00404A3AAE
MGQGSLSSFSAIAYQCLKRAREDRPTMAEIVKELEYSLEQQYTFEDLGNKVDSESFEVPDTRKEDKESDNVSIPSTISAALPSTSASLSIPTPSHMIPNPYPPHLENIFENLGETANLMRIVNLAVPPLRYEQQSQLIMHLLKGFRIDDGETWISINMKGEIMKVVSANKCFSGGSLVSRKSDIFPVAMKYIRSRFPYYSWNVYSQAFRVEVDTQFLSPHVTYTIFIVFKYGGATHYPPYYITFRYKLEGETNFFTSCIPYHVPKDDGWAVSKLYQFTSQEGQQKFCIEFLPKEQIPFKDEFAFEGIEFRPLEGETHEKQGEEENKVDRNLEQLLPSDFTDVIKLSKEVIQWTTNMELYDLLRKGFLITIDGEKWFSIRKDMKKRVMIPASTFLDVDEWTCNSVFEPESRFKVVTKSLIGYQFTIYLNLTETVKTLIPRSGYSCHLIYKLSDNYSSFDGPMVMEIVDCLRTPVVPLSICLNPRCHPPIIGA